MYDVSELYSLDSWYSIILGGLLFLFALYAFVVLLIAVLSQWKRSEEIPHHEVEEESLAHPHRERKHPHHEEHSHPMI